MALASVVSAIRRDRTDHLIGRNLRQQFGEHGGVANTCTRDLDRLNLQRFRADSEAKLEPAAAFGGAMLTRMPFAVTLDFDPGAVDQKMHRPGRSAARQDHGEILLTTAERAEIGNGPIETCQLQEARDEPRRLPQRHPKHYLEREARLDSGIAIDLCVFRGSWAVISREAGQSFRVIVGSRFAKLGRLADGVYRVIPGWLGQDFSMSFWPSSCFRR